MERASLRSRELSRVLVVAVAVIKREAHGRMCVCVSAPWQQGGKRRVGEEIKKQHAGPPRAADKPRGGPHANTSQ